MAVKLRWCVAMCGCNGDVKVFLNPWGLSQLSIQLKLRFDFRGKTKPITKAAVYGTSRGDIKCIMCRHSKELSKFAIPMLTLLPLMLLCYGVGNINCSTIHENSRDLQALMDFKKGVNDPSGALSNWTMSSHFCHWNGVTCTFARPFRVAWLILSDKNLAGEISSSLGNLTFLNYLDLSYNKFVGPLPDALTNCTELNTLDLSSNLLVGSIPPKLGFLSNLSYLNLHSNKLDGSIPGELGQLVKLELLSLGDNRLSGEIPDALFNLSSLKYLSLEMNMLGKALPPNMGELLPNLTELTLGNNTFEGPIPASLGNNALGLELIDLSHNNFTGKIPTSLGKLSNLSILNLDYNQLVAMNNQDWEFFNALTNCKHLKRLSLAYNELHGSIPQSIGNLSTTLQYLLLSGNRLSGQVPQGIGNLSALLILGLGENNFSGTIEGWVEKFKSLQALILESNNFTGPIPSSISNLTQLAYILVSKNEFQDSIPASLGNLRILQLDLSYNNLEGYIPQNFGNLQQLTELNLGHNNLKGAIPHISNLEQLTTLDLSWNKLTGQIPDSLGQCRGLLSMKLDQNFLTGSIPETFGNLTTLSMLNLSHNNLSGTIPKALDAVKSLRVLDLSYNDLHGEVPRNGVFGNATAVSLEGNRGLCGGVMDLHMPSCAAGSKKTETGYYLIRVLIPIFGFMSLILLIYILFLVKKIPSRKYFILTSLGKDLLKVSYNDLAQATSNFSESNLIGRGSYGSVYRGKLKEDNMEVAVKVFDLEMGGAEKSFLKECEVLRSVQHRNLLSIKTACSTVDNTGRVFKALVYKFMANGSLDKWLHHKGDGKSYKQLSLTQRLSISVNIADALDYVHHDCGRPTVHCDLKPSNVLLDDDMNGLLADFGIASFYRDSPLTSAASISTSVGVKGTIGYIAPEYAGGGRHASTSDDVYGYGIILLEMMTGRRPTDPMFKDGFSIVNFVDRNFPHDIYHAIDAHLTEECNAFAQRNKASENNAAHECLVSVLQVALSCTNPIPSDRASMKEIASRMHAIQTSYMSKQGKARQHASLGVE